VVGSTVASAEESTSKTVTIAQETDSRGFDIVKARVSNQTTATASLPVMEGLFAYNDEQEIVPRLGTEFSMAEDGMSGTVTLREGVMFHDGTPFNAEAVAAHYNRIMDPEYRLSTRIFGPIESVDVVDEYTVRFNLNQPWVALKSALAISHMYNFIPSPTALQGDPEGFNTNPVGTGPFKFESWSRNDRIVYSRNESYWDSGLPKIDNLIIRSIPDNQTRLAALKAGEIDIMKTPSPTQVAELQAGDSDNIEIFRAHGDGAVSWNMNHDRPPFNDPEIRKAIVQAIDTEAFSKARYKGVQPPVKGLLGESSDWFCEDANWTTYDLEAAKAVVEEKGPISFKVQSLNSPAGKTLATFMEHFFSEAGFDVTIDLVEQGKNIRDGIRGDYDMNIWRYTDIAGDPDLLLTNNLLSSITNHDTSEYKPLLKEARTETDPEKRQAMYCDIQNKFAEDNLFLIPIQSVYTVLADTSVKNVGKPANSQVEVRDLELSSD
jgi:4-phytase/acid phosphatase/peptide/nickel transport system substrate-binding protein